MITGHGGNIYDLAKRLGIGKDDVIDMSSNLNPLGPPPGLVDFLKTHLGDITALPEVDADGLITAFAGIHGLEAETVLAGQGTTQFIYTLPKALGMKKALIFGPTYSDYEDALNMNQVDVFLSLSDEADCFHYDIEKELQRKKGIDAVFICNPNNPTGVRISGEHIKKAAGAFPDIRFIIDESYLPFSMDAEKHSLISSDLPNILVLSSMSKIYRVPGLRVGFLIGPAKCIDSCRTYQFPWSVNSLAQVAARYIIENDREMKQFVEKSRQYLEKERQYFVQRLSTDTRLTLFSGPVPYLLIKLGPGLVSKDICRVLAEEKILIRDCANFKGLSNAYIRISAKTREVNEIVVDKLLATIKDITSI